MDELNDLLLDQDDTEAEDEDLDEDTDDADDTTGGEEN